MTEKNQEILDYMNGLYALLCESEEIEADECLGLVAQAKAIWEHEDA